MRVLLKGLINLFLVKLFCFEVCLYREDKVDKEYHEDYAYGNISYILGYDINDTMVHWAYEIYINDGEYYPIAAVLETDSSVEVKKVFGIIPPAGVEKLFHNVACEVFEYIGKNYTNQNRKPPALFERIAQGDYTYFEDKCAYAVYGT